MKNHSLLWLCFLMASLLASNAQTPAQLALDGPGFAWAVQGNTFGILVTTNAADTHDGIDGYLTGNITNSQRSGVQTRVFGPGTLTFWWNVSSELGFDYFSFWMAPTLPLHTNPDRVEELRISGTSFIWEQETFQIPAGQQWLEWIYFKDDTDDDGADRGYLDQVFFVPDPPEITNQPPEETTVVPVGTNVTFSVGFIEGGFPNVPNQTKIFWQQNGTNLVGKTNTTLALTNLQVNQSGDYRAVITNLYGITTSDTAVLQVYQPYLIETAVDTTGLVWTTGGDVQWFGLGDPLQSHDGVDVARSGIAPDDFEQLTFTSYVQTTVTGPGVVKFWWKLSGLDTDQFYVSISTLIKTNAPPEDGNWQEETIGIGAGARTVRFNFLRDDYISTDDTDGAFLDQFRFIPATNAPPIFSSPVVDEEGFRTTIQLDPSRAYTIQRSTNLTTWTNVISFTSTDNLYEFIDPSATNLNTRFYRIKSP